MAALRRFVDEVLNLGHYGTMADVIHPDYRYYGPDGSRIQGRTGFVTSSASSDRGSPTSPHT